MVSLKFTALALAAWRAVGVVAQLPEGIEIEELSEIPDDAAAAGGAAADVNTQSPKLNVDISTSFPDSEIFGVKLVNNNPTRAILDISNNEVEPITVAIIGGSLLTPANKPGAPDPPQVVRNLTATRLGLQIPAGGKETVPFSFVQELHPQDLTLSIVTLLQNSEGAVFTKQVYNETVSVVEAPFSFFDPQIIFLYLFLLAAFGGTCFFIYNTWITTLFPQKKRGGKGGERAKRSSGGSKSVDPADQASVIGADGPAVTTGSNAYDESWIPAAHLKRPEAKRVGSGRPKSRAA